MQRLTLEIVRYRDVITEIDKLYKTTHQAWRDATGGNLVALHLLQKLLDNERERMGLSLPIGTAPADSTR